MGIALVSGVVNVLDSRIPMKVPDKGYEGEGELRGNPSSSEMTGMLGFTVGVPGVALRLEGVHRLSDDYFAAKKFGDPPSRRVRNSLNNGWNFSAKGGGYEYPVFWAIGCFTLALIGSGAHAMKPDAGLRESRAM